jgi:uncharacterized protein YjbJ (UPF0337 family)
MNAILAGESGKTGRTLDDARRLVNQGRGTAELRRRRRVVPLEQGDAVASACPPTPQWRREMNWDQVAGNWNQFKGQIKEKWGRLTDDDLATIDGKRDQFIGRVQERYGIAKEEAEKQIKDWERLN